MSKWKLAVCGAALASAACGTATISEHVSTAPAMVRTIAIATANPGSMFAQSGSFVVHGALVKKVGTTRMQGSAPAAANGTAKAPQPANLPAMQNNPCSSSARSAPMCPVAST